jgi:hypothetical protein
VDWDQDKNEMSKGHTIPFMQALVTVVEGLIFRMAFPKWLLCLNKRGREFVRAHDELEVGHLSTLH